MAFTAAVLAAIERLDRSHGAHVSAVHPTAFMELVIRTAGAEPEDLAEMSAMLYAATDSEDGGPQCALLTLRLDLGESELLAALDVAYDQLDRHGGQDPDVMRDWSPERWTWLHYIRRGDPVPSVPCPFVRPIR